MQKIKMLSLLVAGIIFSLANTMDSVAEEDLRRILIEKAAGNSSISAEFLGDISNSTIPGTSTKGVYAPDVEDFEEKVGTYLQGNKEEEIAHETDKNINLIPTLSLANIAPVAVAKAASTEEPILPLNVEEMSFHEGKDWKSQMMPLSSLKILDGSYQRVSGHANLSTFSFLKVVADPGYKEVNFKVQLFDEKTGPGMNQGLSSAHSLKGKGEVYIALSEFDDIDLDKIEGLAIHYGETAFGLPLNDANDGIIIIESMEFTKKKGTLQKIADFFGGIIDRIKQLF